MAEGRETQQNITDTPTKYHKTVWDLRSRTIERIETDPNRQILTEHNDECLSDELRAAEEEREKRLKNYESEAIRFSDLAWKAKKEADQMACKNEHMQRELRDLKEECYRLNTDLHEMQIKYDNRPYTDNDEQNCNHDAMRPPGYQSQIASVPMIDDHDRQTPDTVAATEIAMKSMADLVNLLQNGYPNRVTAGRSTVSDTIISPKAFTGTESDPDAPERFVEQFERYASFKGLDNTEKLRLFAILLKDQASDWLSVQDQDTINTYDTLLKQFKKAYFKSSELRWLQASKIYTTKQGDLESVNSYIVRLKKAARNLDISEAMLHYAFISGLKLTLRNHVLAQGVKTLEDSLNAAKIAETSLSSEPPASLFMQAIEANKKTSELKSAAISALTTQVANLASAQ